MKIRGAVGVLSALLFAAPSWAADPLDDLVLDCTGPAGDPAPGTAAFVVRDLRNMLCTQQRRADAWQHPASRRWMQSYGSDPYREPSRHADRRFRHTATTVGGIAADVFRPCSADSCPDRPAELETFGPPYPVAIVMHGFASDKNHLWWASQPLAEAGYLVVAVNGTGGGIPNNVLTWVNGAADAAFPGELDIRRVGIAGHSLGAENSTSTQGDPRVSAIIAWDPCSSPAGCSNSPGSRVSAEPSHVTPTLYLTADYSGFPGYPQPRTSVPGTLRVSGFSTLRAKGADSMLITPRATTHLDWAGTFPMGNRYAELVSSYYNIAWFDRYLKGKLVLTGNESPAEEAAERAYRQAIAEDAFDRLTADVFDDSADRHNVSQGIWDPAMAAANGDFDDGGNVPYSISGQPVADRLSFYHRSVCYVSAPDYAAGNGNISDPVAARGDSTDGGDMRSEGCPVTP